MRILTEWKSGDWSDIAAYFVEYSITTRAEGVALITGMHEKLPGFIPSTFVDDGDVLSVMEGEAVVARFRFV
jgi:hypothetical protein